MLTQSCYSFAVELIGAQLKSLKTESTLVRMNTKIILLALCIAATCLIINASEEDAGIQGKQKAKPKSPRGNVYLLNQNRRNGKRSRNYKIGKTKQTVPRRVRDLQTGNHRKLEIVQHHNVPNMHETETKAKHAFKHYKTKDTYGGGSEWFKVPKNRSRRRFERKFRESVTGPPKAKSLLQKAMEQMYRKFRDIKLQ